MQKVLVIGCPGAGKSTFARALRDSTGLPLHYLDCLWHRPDGSHVTPEAFDAALAAVMAGPAWIIDGNYLRTMEPRMAACDTIFLLDYPLEVCLAGAQSRVGIRHEDLPWVENEFDPEFRQWILDFGSDQRPELLRLLAQYQPGREVHIFQSRHQAHCYLSALAAAQKAAGPVQLRPYREGDGPALAALFHETVHTVNAAHYTPAQLEAWAPADGPEPADWAARFREHISLVAEIQGQLAGFADLDPASHYLDRLYVSRDFQRRGVASALCDALESAAPGHPILTHASITARPFFERRGYRVTRAQQVECRGVSMRNFVMEKL